MKKIILRLFFNLEGHFVFGHVENLRITPATQGGAAGSAKILLTKNPARSINCPGCRVCGVSFERIPRGVRRPSSEFVLWLEMCRVWYKKCACNFNISDMILIPVPILPACIFPLLGKGLSIWLSDTSIHGQSGTLVVGYQQPVSSSSFHLLRGLLRWTEMVSKNIILENDCWQHR